MNFRTIDWLKSFNSAKPKPITAAQRAAPMYASGDVQKFTGRVGGRQTTAQQTQPLSAILGGWFNPSNKSESKSMNFIISWLRGRNNPTVTAQNLQSASLLNKGWLPSLPQNITNALLRGRLKGHRRF